MLHRSRIRLGGEEERRVVGSAEKSGFDVFLTLDRGIEYEQNLKRHEIAVILLSAKSSRLADVLPQIPAVLLALRSVRVGELVRVLD
jgi:hypothetical protein